MLNLISQFKSCSTPRQASRSSQIFVEITSRMARRSKQSQNKESASIATASRFKNSDGFTDPKERKQEKKRAELDEQKKEFVKTIPENSTNVFGDDPYANPFPLNYIYSTQDFLNDHLDTRKGVQLLILVFILQLFYIYFKDIIILNADKIIMNYTGVLVGTFFTYNLQWKKNIENENFPAPKVPDFNSIYAILIPNFLSVLFDDANLVENFSFNYMTIQNSHLLVRCFSAFGYFYLYGDESNTKPFCAKLLIIALLQHAFEYINQGEQEHDLSNEVVEQGIEVEKVQTVDGKIISGLNSSMAPSEIHLISVAIVNLVFNLKSENINLVIFQKLIMGLITGFILTFPIFQFNKTLSVPVFCGIFYFAVDKFLSPFLGRNCIIYLIELINEPDNFKLISIWFGILVVGIAVVFNVKWEFNLRRKLWHFLIFGTIFPSFVYNPSLTELALLGSIVIFILVEAIRVNKITYLGDFLYKKLYKFQDFKDLKGPLNLSYIYLILGVTIPIVLQDILYKGETNNLKSYIGLVSLGLGDTFASIIGKQWGKYKIPGSNKTFEGIAAFIISSYITFNIIQKYLELTPINWEVLVVVNIIMGMLEGFMSTNDNLVLPPITYVIWIILETGVEK